MVVEVEPHKGMEYESEDATKVFYDEYARQIGFEIRVMGGFLPGDLGVIRRVIA